MKDLARDLPGKLKAIPENKRKIALVPTLDMDAFNTQLAALRTELSKPIEIPVTLVQQGAIKGSVPARGGKAQIVVAGPVAEEASSKASAAAKGGAAAKSTARKVSVAVDDKAFAADMRSVESRKIGRASCRERVCTTV